MYQYFTVCLERILVAGNSREHVCGSPLTFEISYLIREFQNSRLLDYYFWLAKFTKFSPAFPKCWGILENLWIQLGDRQHLGCICATSILAETSGDRAPDFFGAFPTSVWCREDSHLLDFWRCCDCQLFLARTDPQIPSPQWESDYCIRGKAGFHFWGRAQANPKEFRYLPYRNSHISCKKKRPFNFL